MSIKTIPVCDRCHKGFTGQPSIVTVYGTGAISGTGIKASRMEGLPLVYGLHVCPACRAEIDKAMQGAHPGAGAVPPVAVQEPTMLTRGGYDG